MGFISIRCRRLTGFLLTGAAVLSLTACGAKEFKVQQVPSVPLSTFGQVELLPFTVDLAAESEPELRAQANELLLAVRKRLNDRLSSSKLFSDSGKKLIITGKLISFDPGSQAARYIIGFGAGSGEIVTEVTFADESGEMVARGSAVGGVSAGWFGGNVNSAAKRLADAIFKFIAANHESVAEPAPVTPPSRGPKRS
jgi:hypothetical protein